MTDQIDYPSDELTDLMVRAAWLYYVADNNQQETANILGLTRTKITRLLSQARDLGLVKISIEHRLSAMLEVEELIRHQFNLTFCTATPPLVMPWSMGDDEANQRSEAWLESTNRLARRAVGIAGARFLKARLEKNPASCIGIGWGRTLAAVADQISGLSIPHAKFVSLMGSLTRNAAANPFEVVHQFGSRTGGEAHFLPVPFVADSTADKEVFLSQRTVQETLELARLANFYVISLGECDKQSLLYRNKMIGDRGLQMLSKAGAVADTTGRFFNQIGEAVANDFGDRTLAIEFEALQEHEVVLLCAGLTKLKAVRGLLKSGFIDGLIIDGDTAQALVIEDRRLA